MSQPSPSHIRATAVRVATLRRLALSVLFTIATTSYQTTCTVSERTFNKRQHANARYRVEFLTLYASRLGINSFLATCERYYPYDFVWTVRTNKYLNVYVCKIFNLNLRIFLFILQTLVRKEAYFIKVESTITQEKKIISLKIFFVNYKNFF